MNKKSENKKRISIHDVARQAGVSITTVSRVINKVPTVDRNNVVRVEEAVALLKFKPNIIAQRLARGLNTAVGLVMPGYPGIFHSFYALEVIRGVGHSCETLHLDMIFHITNGYNPLNTANVGGVIFADIIDNRKQLESALQENVPCMVMNNVVGGSPYVSYVAIDNFSGGNMATEYLVKLGHKKIATLTGNMHTQSGQQRLKGYKHALDQAKIPIREDYIFSGDYSRRSARLATEELLSLKDRPTAIFSASDDMALEIMAVLLERRMTVPQDLSIIGFDDNPAGMYGPVGLTTVKQPLFEMAEESVKHLNAIVAGKKDGPVQEMLSPSLIIRESCCPPPKK